MRRRRAPFVVPTGWRPVEPDELRPGQEFNCGGEQWRVLSVMPKPQQVWVKALLVATRFHGRCRLRPGQRWDHRFDREHNAMNLERSHIYLVSEPVRYVDRDADRSFYRHGL